MKVLSLFDGISCGQVALERAGIPVEVYYASEIDKYAIQITQKNYPNTIQLGDINGIDFTQFIGKIDLIMGGSPCQDLSIAGKRKGLEGERSGLFYKFVDAVNTIKPKYFLLENNYGMPPEAYEEISKLMGCYPIMINSALVSAQTRKRYYWTNIGDKDYNLFGFPTVAIPQPENKGILLKDILESGMVENDKSYCITQRYEGQFGSPDYTMKRYCNMKMGQIVAEPICVNSQSGRKDGKAKQPSLQNRIYSVQGKSISMAQFQSNYKIDLPDGEYLIRKLTPIECERLQTLPDNYTEGVSNTQRYKAIGNGWTVDVIAHIFSFIKCKEM